MIVLLWLLEREIAEYVIILEHMPREIFVCKLNRNAA
jgi:hypothetical protein